MKRAIVIGATSGIGWAVARLLLQHDYLVGVAGRRAEKLAEFQQLAPSQVFTKHIDVTRPDEAITQLRELIAEMGGLDLLVISSGIGHRNPELDWRLEQEVIDVNVSGFVAVATESFRYFRQQGHGQLAGISSVAAIRGSGVALAYAASKAFISNYMEGLRVLAHKLKLPICITDIRPGYIETPLTHGQQGMFWVASAETAARYIVQAIERKKRIAYTPPRWAPLARLLQILPGGLYERIAAK